jgi:hypothetical protein
MSANYKLQFYSVRCHLPLPKYMARRLDKGSRPYDDDSAGWGRFVAALEKIGASDIDRGLYDGGLTFTAPSTEIAEGIALAARVLLSRKL